jgi:hypothetical protein
MNFLSIKNYTNILIIKLLSYINFQLIDLKIYCSPYAFEQGVPNTKHHCDTKNEPPYLAFTPSCLCFWLFHHWVQLFLIMIMVFFSLSSSCFWCFPMLFGYHIFRFILRIPINHIFPPPFFSRRRICIKKIFEIYYTIRLHIILLLIFLLVMHMLVFNFKKMM